MSIFCRIFSYLLHETTKEGRVVKKDIQFERCVSCGELTNIPVNTLIQKREFYIEGAGQLCTKCGHRFKVEGEEKRKNSMGI